MEFYVNHGYNNLAEHEEKIFTPGIDMYLNSSSVQARHHWNPNDRVQLLSGVQSILEIIGMVQQQKSSSLMILIKYDLGFYSSLFI